MRLSDVPGMAKVQSAPGLLANDSFWSSGHDGMTAMSIQLFFARAGLKGLRQAAIEMVTKAQAVIIEALSTCRLPRGSFTERVLHGPPPPPFLVDEPG